MHACIMVLKECVTNWYMYACMMVYMNWSMQLCTLSHDQSLGFL